MLPRESVLQYTERLQLLRFSKSTCIQCDYVANLTLIYLSLYCYLVLGQSWNMGVYAKGKQQGRIGTSYQTGYSSVDAAGFVYNCLVTGCVLCLRWLSAIERCRGTQFISGNIYICVICSRIT